MPFTKGHTFWDNPKSKTTQFKKGQTVSPKTQFREKHVPWNKGLKGWNAGSANPSWKGGLPMRKKQGIRNDPAYFAWRHLVHLRDNFICRIDNEDCVGKIEVHHILNWSDYPELRYEVNNGITLCHAHHPRKRAEVKRLAPEFQRLVSETSN